MSIVSVCKTCLELCLVTQGGVAVQSLQRHCCVSTLLLSETKPAAARCPCYKMTRFAERCSVGNLIGSLVTHRASVWCTNILIAQGSICTTPLYLSCHLILKIFPIISFFLALILQNPVDLHRSIKCLSQPLQRSSTEKHYLFTSKVFSVFIRL